MRNKLSITGSVLALALAISPVVEAKVSASEAAKLKSSLTPFGAIKKGDGKEVPAWDGGITKDKIPSSYTSSGQHHPDPFASDEVLFTIDATNLDKYKAKVPGGLQALIEKYPDTFKMNVYKSRRTHSAPQWVYDNTIKNATSGALLENGITGAIGGIPFPILANAKGQPVKDDASNADEVAAKQAIWNHIMRWRGEYVVRRASEVAVQRSGRYSLVTSQQEIFFNYYSRGASEADLNNIIFYYLSFTKSPARLAGGAVLVHETMDQKKQPRLAWGYNAGQRRVRMAPNLSYDTPIAAADGLRTADDTDIYNGSPDRYDWKLLGRKVMYIPYNNYEIDSPDLKYKDILQKGHVNSEYTRYEAHRVWVVEATLKKGKRHSYSKRTFYLDEDSWQIAVVDQYDRRGSLWRVSMAYIKNYYEVPTTWSALDVFHDLRSGRYHVQYLDNEEPTLLDFSQAIPSKGYFSQAALRRRGRR